MRTDPPGGQRRVQSPATTDLAPSTHCLPGAEALDGLDQLCDVEWLRSEADWPAEGEGTPPDPVIDSRGQDHRHVARGSLGAQLVQHGPAILARHHDVEQDDIRP